MYVLTRFANNVDVPYMHSWRKNKFFTQITISNEPERVSVDFAGIQETPTGTSAYATTK
jgi:hypothetical protein